MSRLTKEDILKFPMTIYGRSIGKQFSAQVVGELLQYKTLEEELGCSLDKAAKVLYIIITKELNVEDFRTCVEKNENDYEAFDEFNSKQWTSSEISLEEYFLIKNVYYEIIERFYGLKDKSE